MLKPTKPRGHTQLPSITDVTHGPNGCIPRITATQNLSMKGMGTQHPVAMAQVWLLLRGSCSVSPETPEMKVCISSSHTQTQSAGGFHLENLENE